MKGLIKLLPSIRAIIFSGLLLASSLHSFSQACYCPPLASSGTCQAGMISMTLQFNGAAASTIIATDQFGVAFTGVVNPGGVITFGGTNGAGKFGSSVTMSVNGVDVVTFDTSCGSSSFYIGLVAGGFTVIAGESKNGGPLTCGSQPTPDTTPPVILNCPANITVCSVGAVNWTPPTATDDCIVVSFTSNHNPGSTFPSGTTLVTYTAKDSYGNTATCSFNVTVNAIVDTTPPVISCPSDITVSSNGSCKGTATWTVPTATDNCGTPTVTQTAGLSSGSTFPLGQTTITYKATDASLNSSSCSFKVIVLDNIPPAISCPSDITIFANGTCQGTATWNVPTATDNCGTPAVTQTAGLSSGSTTFPLGQTTITYKADDGNGNTTSCSFKVIVLDNTAPVFTSCSANITVPAVGCTGLAVWSLPIATDNCGIPTVTQTQGPVSGLLLPVGTTTVTYTATDATNNVATCSFTVTVVENTPPVFTVVPSNITVSANGSCNGTATWTIPTATDNCGSPTITQTAGLAPGSTTFPLGVTTITYRARDGANNDTFTSFTVTVNDTTFPVFTVVPSNITVSANGSCQGTAKWLPLAATDNCGLPTITQTAGLAPAATNFPLGTTTITYRARDGAGNDTFTSFDVVVVDNTAPVFTVVPSNISVFTNGSCQGTASWTVPTAVDNCAATVTQIGGFASGATNFPLGVTTITYEARDAANNVATSSFTVTVMDNIVSVFTVVPSNISVSANGSCFGTATWTIPAATDNCGTPTMTQTAGLAPAATNFPLGTTTITYRARDGAGNDTFTSFDVIVVDNIAPVFTVVPSNISVFADGNCFGTATWTIPTATDNCGTPTITQTAGLAPAATNFPLGTITYRGRDGAGNDTFTSFDVIVTDNIAPVFTVVPTNTTVSADGSGLGTASWSDPTAADNCGTPTVIQTAGLASTSTNFPLGITTITYEARDVANNIATCSFTVKVVDTTPPVFTVVPATIPVSADGSGLGTASWTDPTATDNCGATVTQIGGLASGATTFPLGVTTITYEARDAANNIATSSFTVTVIDNIAPVFTASSIPTNITVFAYNSCQGTAMWLDPTATDNCATPTVRLTSSFVSGSTNFPLGITTITYAADDGNGNSSTCSFNVIVIDKTAPVITGCLSTITAFADATCQAYVSWAAPTATDNCTLISFTPDHAPGMFPVGTTTVTYTAIDNSGNKQTCSFNVIVNGTSPVIEGCPDDIIVNADENGNAVLTWTEPKGSVQCGHVTVEKSNEPGSIFTVGINPIVYIFTDDYGNSSECTFNISVLEHDALFAVAKAVTPDGDGINDVWVLTNIDKYENTVLVVDRWGNQIYNATGYNNQNVVWNATNTNGTPVPTGTYFYKIEVHAQGKIIHKTGFLEVIQ